MPNEMAISLQPPKTIVQVTSYIFGPWDFWDLNNTGFGGLTARIHLTEHYISRSASGLQLLPGYLATTYGIQKCYIGHQAEAGNDWDFDGNQVQVKWSGNDGVTVDQDDLWSDVAAIAITKHKAMIVSFYLSAVASIPYWSTSFASFCYYKAGDYAADTAPGAFSACGYQGKLQLVEAIKPH